MMDIDSGKVSSAVSNFGNFGTFPHSLEMLKIGAVYGPQFLP